MKFNEAMELLKKGSKVTRSDWMEGSKITRKNWMDGLYFIKEGESIKSYQPKIDHYNYVEDIMISEGWNVQEKEGEFKFCDIIPFLQEGYTAKLKEWKDSYIFLDAQQCLLIHTLMIFPFMPTFNDFLAEDWIEIK